MLTDEEIAKFRAQLTARAHEKRSYAAEFKVELASAGSSGRKKVQGYASVFGQDAEMWFGTEEIAPGTFSQTIKADDVRALFNHDESQVLARNVAGTLQLREDTHGLEMEFTPGDTSYARDLEILLERREVSQASFGFVTLDDAWSIKNGAPHRTLRRVQLFDVSPVTFPAFPQTDVGVRSMELRTAIALGKMRDKLSLTPDDLAAMRDFEKFRSAAAVCAPDRRRRLRLAEAEMIPQNF